MGLTDIAAGLTGRFSGDDDEPDETGDLDGGGEGDFGDLDGDDEFDDLGGWDDEEEGELGDLGGEEAGGTSDLEPRLDELEQEVEAISSTMGTVRSENEAIGETVEEIEDNIRKLLEIYEMVTQGVNPFTDEAEAAAGMGDSFSLFDGGDGGSADELDDEVADADADSFFEDDWEEEPVEDEPADPDPAEDGTTFDELKSEYESDEADWADGAPAEDPDAKAEDAPTSMEADGKDDEEDAPAGEEGVESEERTGTEKPYLPELPTGYGTDLLVIEWLSFLRQSSSTPEALRAIRYYETIGWLGSPAAESLAEYLTGLDGDGAVPLPEGSTQLTVDHHTRSLGYIGELCGADVTVDRLEWASPSGPTKREGGKQRGIQR